MGAGLLTKAPRSGGLWVFVGAADRGCWGLRLLFVGWLFALNIVCFLLENIVFHSNKEVKDSAGKCKRLSITCR